MTVRRLLPACLTILALGIAPSTAFAGSLELDADWSTSPAELTQSADEPFHGDSWRNFKRRERQVTLFDGVWTQFFIFHDGELVAQGYERAEKPQTPRVGTISDIVSYDNQYSMADALEGEYGDPDFKDVRTQKEYSQEMGDAALRARRSVDWDLDGERYRWEQDDSVIRYAVRFSLKGVRDHKVVRVKSDAVDTYFAYTISRAFRKAGLRLVQRFERRSKKTIVAMVTSSGETVKMEVDAEGDKLVPVEPERRQFTRSNCKIKGQDCKVTYYTYGGRIYKAVVDVSSSGSVGRRQRAGLEKAGKKAYDLFLYADDRLEGVYGEPANSNGPSKDELTDGRKERKVQNIPRGMEAFWTVWYNPAKDLLIRHSISGKQANSSYRINHRVTFRLHSVTRAFREEAAWKVEARKVERTKTKKPSDTDEAKVVPEQDGDESDTSEGEGSDEE